MKEWIVCEGNRRRCPRNTYCPCVTFVSFAAGKLAPVAQPITTTFERPRKRLTVVTVDPAALAALRERIDRMAVFL